MITAQWDSVLPAAYAASMPERFSDLEITQIDECGHWTQQNQPDALNAILVDWLTRRFH
jgi:pimeloyl-ACP methyl ester carboxylesterase